MRTVLVRRAVLSASAVSLALVTTACGTHKAGDAAAELKAGLKPSSGPASSPAAAGPKGKSADELAPLLVAPADLPDHKLETVTDSAAQDDPIESDKPACKPLAQAEAMQPIGTSTGVVRLVANGKPEPAAEGASAEDKPDAGALKVTATSVALVSYDGKGAEEAFATVRAGVQACSAGYTVRQSGETTSMESVNPDSPLPGGDEMITFTTVMDLKDGDKNATRVAVVRRGNTLAMFAALSLSGQAEQPKSVVDAQVRKLG